MVLFTDTEPDVPQRRGRAEVVGWLLLVLSVVTTLVLAVSPAPYVIELPGPVFDTLGTSEVDGEAAPLIEVPDERTYDTEGALKLLTVSIEGSPEQQPTWSRIAAAWFQPDVSVVPLEAIYPSGTTQQQSSEQSRVEMRNSQQDAIAAALTELGYDVPSTLRVSTVLDGPAQGVLEPGDELVSVNGTAASALPAVQDAVRANGTGQAATIVVRRDGRERSFDITPETAAQDGRTPIIGIETENVYDFPFEVDIRLDNVGGPSAGMMFALGIVDVLTPGALTGGMDVAGTGTIAADGTVGPIGGIRQKLYAARDSGSTWFLAPESNCNEVVGHVPDGIQVVAVSTLEDSLDALDVISADGDTSALPTCTAGS